MNWIQNVWQHPKTSLAGLLIAVVTIAGVLTQNGITLGRAGTGSVVGIAGAIAAALLGLLARDPGAPANSGAGPTLTALLLVAFLPALLFTGCLKANPNGGADQRQKAVAAIQKAQMILAIFQEAETVAHDNKLIPDGDHAFIQQQLQSITVLNSTAITCVQSTTTPAGVVPCIDTAIAALDGIEQQGGLYLKSDKAKADFKLAMEAAKIALAVIGTVLAPPAQHAVLYRTPLLYQMPRARVGWDFTAA